VVLEEVLDAAERPLRRVAEEKSIAVVRGMTVDRPLRVDPARMAQVFNNILSNAIKFTSENGSVEIDAEVTGTGGLLVLVSDNGIGITAEELARVLQPFSQAEDHLTRQNSGLGLGLPIARALTRMHGGDLAVASEIGKGTTVRISLPAERVLPSAAAPFA
jgi:two-component system cell cycle sensor histidine kinase PleC